MRVAVPVDFGTPVRVLVWDWKVEEAELVASTSKLPTPAVEPPVVQQVLRINPASIGKSKPSKSTPARSDATTKSPLSRAAPTTKGATPLRISTTPNPLAPSFVPISRPPTTPRNGRSKGATKCFEVRYLPSIDLEFTLSPLYPTEKPPCIDIVSNSDGDWLTGEWKAKLVEKMLASECCSGSNGARTLLTTRHDSMGRRRVFVDGD